MLNCRPDCGAASFDTAETAVYYDPSKSNEVNCSKGEPKIPVEPAGRNWLNKKEAEDWFQGWTAVFFSARECTYLMHPCRDKHKLPTPSHAIWLRVRIR
jgi:hypothetical protein